MLVLVFSHTTASLAGDTLLGLCCRGKVSSVRKYQAKMLGVLAAGLIEARCCGVLRYISNRRKGKQRFVGFN